jgi:hypothetical protein
MVKKEEIAGAMNHTIRLKSGNLLDVAPSGGMSIPAPDQLVKKTILVHAGQFQSMDGPIDFDSARIQRLVQNHNSQIEALANSYGGIEQMPLGAYPPILEDHEESNQRIIGRLSGLLEYAELDIPGVGKKVPAAVAPITFIGKENTLRVLDGRIYHVSIGINTESDTLSETSVVVTPAAPGAMLLSRGKVQTSPSTKQGEKKMPHAMKKAALPEERKARLHALRGEIDQVNRTIKSSQDQLRLKAKEGKITHRLKAALGSGKLTPAELKQMMDDGDVKRLASMSDEASELLLKTIEKRQHVIEPGQRGSVDALEGGQVAKEVGLKRLKAETRSDILGKARLKKMDGEEKSSTQENPFEKKAAKHLEESDAKKKEEAELSGKDVAGAADSAVVGDEAQSKLAELENQVAQLQSLVAKLMDEVKLSLDEEGEEHKELEAEEEKETDKLAAEDEKRESDEDPADKKPEGEKK